MEARYLFILAIFILLLIPESKASATSFVYPNQKYNYEEMTVDIKQLAKYHPGLVTYKSLGKTPYGREVWAVKLGKGDATVFFNSSHHAREWLTTNLTMEMIDQYSDAYKYKRKMHGYDVYKLLNETSIWFVPMVNPDGVTLQQYGVKKFPKSVQKSLIAMNNGSKNFKRWKSNAQGIDLNRQYPAGWTKRSVKKPYYKDYPGKAPLVAPEAKYMYNFTNFLDPEMTVSYHSTGRILFWHYQTKPQNYNRDYLIAKDVSKFTGYKLVKPNKNASGAGYKDWFISKFGRPALTPEISYPVYESNPPISVFNEEWRRNSKMGLYVAAQGKKLWDAKIKVTNMTITTFESKKLYDKPDNKYITKDTLSANKYTVTGIKGSWYRVSSSKGSKWIPSSNTIKGTYKTINVPILLTETTATYSSPFTNRKTALALKPQTVQAVKQWNDWYAIKTIQGERWINPTNEIYNYKPVKTEKEVLIGVNTNAYSLPNAKNNLKPIKVLEPAVYSTKYSWNGWVAIQISNQIVWVKQTSDVMDFLPTSLQQTIIVETEKILYSLPLDSKQTDTIIQPQEIQVIAEFNGWYQVKVGEIQGWIIKE
ncbi:M14 family metallopeptidase [Bacillus suaedaesalsae]|uniref:M14 family metallocarboxypeptidase n=1 Tax=Bacillus suaedaesalsae TaxID=2810349 RepID=A0ABS2DL19_9BACI|nr:M14 family metallocarboxypeptidase [Bacillus suaedaesalsae]MBM6619111.1 M14 family metallocarboxypeptidase [Bacillus suaedaesalsae]